MVASNLEARKHQTLFSYDILVHQGWAEVLLGPLHLTGMRYFGESLIVSAPHADPAYLVGRVPEAVKRSIVLDAHILLDIGVLGLEGPRTFQDVLEADRTTLAIFERLIRVIKGKCCLR